MRLALVSLLLLAGCASNAERVNPRCIDDCQATAVRCLTWKAPQSCQNDQKVCVQRCRGA